ncbi:MAG: hypothetical protein HYZ15_14420 [Sphingobacteriales bacterium]|nr:hypothetical protein [Sphingobacteriales bacterium]
MKELKKKVIYISNVNVKGPFLPGVVEKIKGQLAAFRNHGFEIDLLYPAGDGTVVIEKQDGTASVFKGAREKYPDRNIFAKIRRHISVTWYGSINFTACSGSILDSGYDAVYLRFYMPGRDLISFLKKIKKRSGKTVILLEYPTLNVKASFVADLPRRINYFFNQGRVQKLNDLADYLITLTKDRVLFGRPAVFMANGIELKGIIPVNPTPFTDTIIILGVASDCAFYHGFDKVIRGIAAYNTLNSEVKVKFRIISNPLSKNVDALKSLTAELGMNEWVSFEPVMTRKELEKVYSEVHIGMGTLALHRIGLQDNYSLKHREYAAFGLPFIMSKGDEHFEYSPFVLTVERDEEPLPVQKIVAFYKDIRERYPDYPNRFRESVEKQITWEGQLQGVFDVIEKGK